MVHHDIFTKNETANDAKFARRIASCYIELDRIDDANEVVHSMTEADSSNMLTRYVKFRIELRIGSTVTMTQSVHELILQKELDMSLLCHCALEAQALGRKEVSLAILSQIIARTTQSMGQTTSVIRMPALLRCTIRIIRDLLDENRRFIEVLCSHLEITANLVSNQEACIRWGFTTKELDWFSAIGINMAIRCATTFADVPHATCLRILSAVNTILKAYPTDLSDDTKLTVNTRRLHCLFMMICNNAWSVKVEENVSRKRLINSSICSVSSEFITLLGIVFPDCKLNEVMRDKLGATLTFEFQALISLESWHSLQELLTIANRYGLSALPLNCMTELIINSNAPQEVMFRLLRTISDATMRRDDCDINLLSRWLRLLFNVALNMEATILDDLLIRIVQVIRDHKAQYPVDEIQWLAAKCFNHAIDQYHANSPTRCHKMCEVALSFGKVSQDENLRAQIERNYALIIEKL